MQNLIKSLRKSELKADMYTTTFCAHFIYFTKNGTLRLKSGVLILANVF